MNLSGQTREYLKCNCHSYYREKACFCQRIFQERFFRFINRNGVLTAFLAIFNGETAHSKPLTFSVGVFPKNSNRYNQNRSPK